MECNAMIILFISLCPVSSFNIQLYNN